MSMEQFFLPPPQFFFSNAPNISHYLSNLLTLLFCGSPFVGLPHLPRLPPPSHIAS